MGVGGGDLSEKTQKKCGVWYIIVVTADLSGDFDEIWCINTYNNDLPCLRLSGYRKYDFILSIVPPRNGEIWSKNDEMKFMTYVSKTKLLRQAALTAHGHIYEDITRQRAWRNNNGNPYILYIYDGMITTWLEKH